MIKIINWTARRAGGQITINGMKEIDTQPIKVVGVDNIVKSNTGPVVATDKNGVRYELA